MSATAIPQNVAQFEKLYKPFALRWDREQALRLVLWLCAEAGVLDQPREDVNKIDADRARDLLTPLWGYKLGPPRSKEARSVEFVLGALSDFKGRVQARDLVRFLRYAAEASVGQKVEAPLLLPRAIREATIPCGKEKLRELLTEIVGLKGPIDKLLTPKAPSDARTSPFDPKDFALSAADLQLLDLAGLVQKESDQRYWLTEQLAPPAVQAPADQTGAPDRRLSVPTLSGASRVAAAAQSRAASVSRPSA